MFFDPQPWLVYIARDEKIDFVRGMELKSVMETDQHSRNLGTVHESTIDSDLWLPINYRYHEIDTKVYINR